MSRTQLFLLGFFISAILLILGVIFIIDRNNRSQTPSTSKEYLLEGMANGSFSTDETESFLYLYTKIDKIKKNGRRVLAELTTTLAGKTAKFDIVLFDKNILPALALRMSPDKNNLYVKGSKTKTFGDFNSVFDNTKVLEGKPAQILFPLKPPPSNVETLKCNRYLLNYLRGTLKQLNCAPFAFQIAAYGK